MNDWDTPDDVRLSPRERLALLRIEADLQQDRRLARAMGSVEPTGPARRTGAAPRDRTARPAAGPAQRPRPNHRQERGRRRLWLPLAVLLLGAASVFVAVMGIRTSDPVLLWGFALLWPLTLLQAFRLLCRAARPPRSGSGGRTSPWL
ncbi:DUF3040 domain-containing protein [Streptomyces bungoensis]|uniref:DUF3040 domain-containing protein n=1 Tax=Streptomyces bungoensis TaxID=285568 RepID=UPI00341988AB